MIGNSNIYEGQAEAEMKEMELGRNCSKPKNEPIEMWEFQLIVDLQKNSHCSQILKFKRGMASRLWKKIFFHVQIPAIIQTFKNSQWTKQNTCAD